MLSDWLAHTPLSVVSQNLGINISELANIPQKDPYIIQATKPPAPLGHASDDAPKSPEGDVPSPFVFRLKNQEKQLAKGGGGWVKIQDSTNFAVSFNFISFELFSFMLRYIQASKTVASALVFIEPNGLRELHWHTVDGQSYSRCMFLALTEMLQNGCTLFTAKVVQLPSLEVVQHEPLTSRWGTPGCFPSLTDIMCVS